MNQTSLNSEVTLRDGSQCKSHPKLWTLNVKRSVLFWCALLYLSTALGSSQLPFFWNVTTQTASRCFTETQSSTTEPATEAGKPRKHGGGPGKSGRTLRKDEGKRTESSGVQTSKLHRAKREQIRAACFLRWLQGSFSIRSRWGRQLEVWLIHQHRSLGRKWTIMGRQGRMTQPRPSVSWSMESGGQRCVALHRAQDDKLRLAQVLLHHQRRLNPTGRKSWECVQRWVILQL